MPTATEQSAQELLGGGFGPSPDLFSPNAFGAAMTVQDRYRSMIGALQQEQGLQRTFTDIAQQRNSFLRAERDTKAMEAETSVLAELDKLDPLSTNFEKNISQFHQMSSVSSAVREAMEVKMGQREVYNSALGELAAVGAETGMSEEEFSSTQATARDLLRRGDLQGYRELLARQKRLAISHGEDRALRRLRREGRVRENINIRAEDRKEERDIAREERTEERQIAYEDRQHKRQLERDKFDHERSIEYQLEKARYEDLAERSGELQKASESNVKEQREMMNDIPQSLVNDPEFEGFFKSDWITVDPRHVGTDTYIAAQVEGMSPEELEAEGITQEQAAALLGDGQNPPSVSQIEVPRYALPEEDMVQKLTNERLARFVVDLSRDEKTKFGGFSENVMAALSEDKDALSEFADTLASAALNSDEDTFLSLFASDERSEKAQSSSSGEGPNVEVDPASIAAVGVLEALGMSLGRSTRAKDFLRGLHREAQAIKKLANKKREIPEVYPELGRRFEEQRAESAKKAADEKAERDRKFEEAQREIYDRIWEGF
jgi:hypothetical protein